MGEFVSGNYFRTFGLQPHAGRLLMDADDVPGAPMAAVMSYETWQQNYAGDPSVVGSTFRIDTKPSLWWASRQRDSMAIGWFPIRLAFYLPIEAMPALANANYVHDPSQQWLYLIGRVKPGCCDGSAAGKIKYHSAGSLRVKRVFRCGPRSKFVIESPYCSYAGRRGNPANARLVRVAGTVLLIACANIANLLVVRGMARSAEMSMRTALGAVRGRIVRQLLTESLVLAGLGGIAGLAVSFAGTRMLLTLAFPGAKNIPIHAYPSLPVTVFALTISLLTGILFGMAPAWIASNAQPANALRSGSRTTATGASLLQRGLVVTQVALSLVLLVGAGLFLQSLTRLESSDLKLDDTNRYIVHVNPQEKYSAVQIEALYRAIEDRFHALPGVLKVGIASYTPMEDNNNGWGIQVQGKPFEQKGGSRLHANAEYFDSVGTKLLMGRGIKDQDTATAAKVAVVNQTFVKQLFAPGENPIGRRFGSPGPASRGDFEIVVVVEDTVYTNVHLKDHLMYFILPMQRPPSDKEPIDQDESLYSGAVVLQTDRPVNDMETLVRKTLAGINPNLTVTSFETFSDQIAGQFTQERMLARLTTLSGLLALLLATIGLYGVTAYSVARRAPEIGIRMALGAQRRGVVAMILRDAVIQTAIGLALGIPVALLSVRFVKSQLYEITNADARVMLGAILTLATAAGIAAIVPALRAASIDPLKALRME